MRARDVAGNSCGSRERARAHLYWMVLRRGALQGHFLAWLLEAEQGRAFAITQNMSSSSVTDGIRALLQVPQIQRKDIGDLSELLSAISNTGSERNRLVHGIWSPGAEPVT